MTSVITTAEVQTHKKRDSLWLIIHDDVYDVTKFIEEHPGGEETLLDAAGLDATQAFEDVGHSEDARELLKKYKIGTLPEEEKSSKKPSKMDPNCCKMRKNSRSDCNSVSSCLNATSKQSKTSWRSFDNPSGSDLTSKGSKGTTRFVVPPDKSDEPATPTASTKRITCCEDKSTQIKSKKRGKGAPPLGMKRCKKCGKCGKPVIPHKCTSDSSIRKKDVSTLPTIPAVRPNVTNHKCESASGTALQQISYATIPAVRPTVTNHKCENVTSATRPPENPSYSTIPAVRPSVTGHKCKNVATSTGSMEKPSYSTIPAVRPSVTSHKCENVASATECKCKVTASYPTIPATRPTVTSHKCENVESCKATRFAEPEEKERPTSSKNKGSKSKPPKHKRKGRNGRGKRKLPCDGDDTPVESGSNWKWIALAVVLLGAVAAGVIVLKKQ